VVGVRRACESIALPRSTYYRWRRSHASPVRVNQPRPTPARALSQTEKETVHNVLTSERFYDSPPRQVFAALLDEGTYYCSWRTMYRLLAEQGQVRERRNQLTHPVSAKPQLVATGPNQLWSWDITKLKGPMPWTFYYLYVVLDVFSRLVVGWLLAARESAVLAEQLLAESCVRQGVAQDQLTLHADRGPSMRSKTVALLLADLGVTKSHSRPRVPDDNPFSEAQFKTMKYRPDYPARFGSLAAARQWARSFFHWYNYDHYHSALGLMTPAMVHAGLANTVAAQRQAVLSAAYAAHPERFVKGQPAALSLPAEVWINPPLPVGGGAESS
jgi:putative transposase